MKSYLKNIVIEASLGEGLRAGLKKTGKEISDDMVKSFANGLDKVITTFTDKLTNAFKDVFNTSVKELKSMLDFSQLSSSKTRDYALNYGMSSAQAYGFDKAKSLLGVESDEDLYYLNAQELAQFKNAFEKYSNKYQDLYDDGFFTKMQEFEVEMGEFKDDVTLALVEFFIDNKETIKAAMNATMQIADVILDIFDLLLSAFNENNDTTSSADIVSSYITTNSSSKNATINNTYNGIGNADKAELANMGSMTYKQVIEYFTGGN